MSIRLNGSSLVIVVVVGLALCQPGKAQAQPPLTGRWVAVAPPGASTSYEFGVGEYIGNGFWRGPFTYYWYNYPIVSGRYELRFYNGLQGTLGLMEGCNTGTRVGNIDLTRREWVFMGITYRP